MELVYGIKDKPSFGKVFLFSLQQLLAVIAATIAVPAIVGNGLSASAALFGAGIGTFTYLLFTKSSSPVFLGSSFAFIGSMFSAFGGAASVAIGTWGLIIGAIMAGLVYVIIAIIVKYCGIRWIDKLMPPVIIGPTVSIIGLSLSSNAVSDLMKSSVSGGSTYVALICGLITLAVTMICSTYGKKIGRLIPFIIGILAGYLCASIFSLIGYTTNNQNLIVINYSAFLEVTSFFALPKFTFLLGGFEGLKGITPTYLLTIFAAYVPVAFVVFAEHLADHKNLSSIVEVDLLKEPGLTRTLLGDGIGTIFSTFFGGCPSTTYGESIGCVAITRNASTISIWGCAIMCIVFSLISPLVAFLETIPNCVMGGVCIALYGFISISGFKMFQKVDLNLNKNLFVASVIFITGVGGMVVKFGKVEIRTVACALILGILTNILLSGKSADEEVKKED
ncbi:uracil-xanthine permease family protein [Treponema pectinovorum]|uniref:uracil-xanthine permease family protein n=1 Tax=Treponema pectinovorum TaxID=164 RepID=UPI003D90095E